MPSQNAMRDIPSSPSPPTDKPITAPPLYDTSSAAGWPPFFAAMAVRPLAEVAALIPENPAATLAIAPKTNAMAVSMPPSSPLITKSTTPTTTTNTEMYLYSDMRKAIAPF